MRLKWIVEFEVDESWVADGFELTNERAAYSTRQMPT
jgi:hypothetical protein